jgi:2-polyprenyl-3-methyl-5-hydroxy-6-metoxy-1,4-benzoquinol methylase
MPNFAKRSYKKELLDGDGIPFKDIEQNMLELDMVNTLLGGHNITIAGIKFLLKQKFFNKSAPLHICEIGSGGGDNLRVIKNWCAKNKVSANFTGIDINSECIAYAMAKKDNNGISFICSDYKEAKFEQQPDIIFSSLFCHHFTEVELREMLGWCQQNALYGFFINDLHRHPLAYYSIRILTYIFSKSYLVKNDAPLSVLRGFSKNEILSLLTAAGITNYSIKWKWAFRWLVCIN